MDIRLCLAPTMLLVLAACGGGAQATPSAPQAMPVGQSSERLTLRPAGSVEGVTLGFVEYLPRGYGDGAPRPLLVFLHGVDEHGGGTEVELRRLFELGVPSLIEKDHWPAARPFIVLMPQYGPVAAESCQLEEEVDSFLSFAMDQYDVDIRRVYLTGVSCGAIGAWDYLAGHGDDAVAAAVLVAGRANDAFDEAGCQLARVPIWAFHGALDEIVPANRITATIEDLNACVDPAPVDLQLTIYPDADHDAWTRTYDLSAGHDVYAWLLEHERP